MINQSFWHFFSHTELPIYQEQGYAPLNHSPGTYMKYRRKYACIKSVADRPHSTGRIWTATRPEADGCERWQNMTRPCPEHQLSMGESTWWVSSICSFLDKGSKQWTLQHTHTHTKTQWIRVCNICFSQNGCVPKAMLGGDGDGCGGRLKICIYTTDVIASDSLSLQSMCDCQWTGREERGQMVYQLINRHILWRLLIYLGGLS